MADETRKQPSDRREREAELDRFWNIDSLIPSRRPSPVSRNTDTVEIEVNVGDATKPERAGASPAAEVIHPAENRLNIPRGEWFVPPHSAKEEVNPVKPVLEYEPSGYLLREVRVYPWRSAYRYYEEFAQTAEHLHSLRGRPSPAVPFFSYVPQYSQLRREQMTFYLWWRDCLRRGEPIPADYSYVLLYIYELINLSESIPPEEVQAGLLSVWVHYRSIYPQLLGSLSEWICDHASIHRLGPPACDAAARSELIANCALKEFYVPAGGEVGYVRCLLAFNSAYDFRKSKFCTAETERLFEQTVFTVLKTVTSDETTRAFFELPSPETAKLLRDAYSGALCSYRIKRKLEVSYSAFFRSHHLRVLVSDVVKYTENHIRAHLGVRSRLTIYALPTPIRARIDAYFAANLPPKKRERAAEPQDRSYEKLYDLPQKEFSISDAAEIERLSWNTTKRLVEAFETPEPDPIPPISEPPSAAAFPSQPPAADPNGEFSRFAPFAAFLRAVAAGNAAEQREAARALGKLPDAAADEINRIAVDLFGDILIEEREDGYAAIDDYKPEFDRLLKTL